MEEIGLILSLAIAFGAALIGGVVAKLLKQPSILGYLIAGIAIGPYLLGLIQDTGSIQTLATIGVVLLLFTLGIEFSFKELKRVRGVAIFGGLAQVTVTTILGTFIGILLLKQTINQAVVFGSLLAFSSTMVVIGMLIDKGEANSVHGKVMIGILLLQDVVAAFAMFILPTLGIEEGGLLPIIGIAFLKAGIFIAIVIIAGIWFIPRLLRRVALHQSRELFILSISALCLGGAFGAYYFGLSAALGAFVIGLMVSESDFAHQALGDMVPLRDLFAALFFVSVGMLIDLHFLASHIVTLLILSGAIIVVKFIISAGLTRAFGYRGKTPFLVGIGLVQIGEFSFVLAQLCLDAGVITGDIYSTILGSAVITIVFTPMLFTLLSRICTKRREQIQITGKFQEQVKKKGMKFSKHVIVCGHGRVGHNVAHILGELNILYVVVELDPKIIFDLRAQGIPCVYGDAGNIMVLTEAGIHNAEVLVLAIHDPIAIRLALDYARRINPSLDIIARAHSTSELESLQRKNVSEVVWPETEASIEIARHVLCFLNIPIATIENIVAQQRNICVKNKP
ncbi:MAG: cation:proton antiporter [Dehalococcoidia bacterium]|nr:cation:proton antiporter [Dehalococcoidia bacterium]